MGVVDKIIVTKKIEITLIQYKSEGWNQLQKKGGGQNSYEKTEPAIQEPISSQQGTAAASQFLGIQHNHCSDAQMQVR